MGPTFHYPNACIERPTGRSKVQCISCCRECTVTAHPPLRGRMQAELLREKPRSSGRKPCNCPSRGPRNSIAPQSKQKQVVKNTVCVSPALRVGAAGVAVRRLRRLLARRFVHLVSVSARTHNNQSANVWRRCFDASFARNDGDERPWLFCLFHLSLSLSLLQLLLFSSQLLLVLGAAG